MPSRRGKPEKTLFVELAHRPGIEPEQGRLPHHLGRHEGLLPMHLDQQPPLRRGEGPAAGIEPETDQGCPQSAASMPSPTAAIRLLAPYHNNHLCKFIGLQTNRRSRVALYATEPEICCIYRNGTQATLHIAQRTGDSVALYAPLGMLMAHITQISGPKPTNEPGKATNEPRNSPQNPKNRHQKPEPQGTEPKVQLVAPLTVNALYHKDFSSTIQRSPAASNRHGPASQPIAERPQRPD